MAIIKDFECERNAVQLGRQTEAHAKIVVDGNQGCVKILTFGSAEREVGGAVSQNVTLTKDAARKLRDILNEIV